MSRFLTITFFILSFASISCDENLAPGKGQPAQTEKSPKDIRLDHGDNEARDSLVKTSGDSIVVDISQRDSAIKRIFGKPVHSDSGGFVSTSKALKIPQKPLGRTTDYEGIFTQDQVDTLNSIISIFKQETTNEIAVVTIDSDWTTKESFDSSITALHNYWGVGEKGKNNGVVLGLSAGLRKIRISNGYGIKLKLSDSETKEIIDDTMIPYFKEGNYFEGLRQGLLAIMLKLR